MKYNVYPIITLSSGIRKGDRRTFTTSNQLFSENSKIKTFVHVSFFVIDGKHGAAEMHIFHPPRLSLFGKHFGKVTMTKGCKE